MKLGRLVLLLTLTIGFGACSQVRPAPRDEIAANLLPVLKIESRADRIKYYTKTLGFTGGEEDDNGQKLKAHYDVYYVYYLAANLNLARGDVNAYLANVKSAAVELDAMEAILRDSIGSKLNEQESEKKSWMSRSAF